VSNADLAQLILKSTATAGVGVTEKQAQLLSRHIRIMLEWNSRINLTRITGPEEIIVKHLLDCILPSKFLPSSGQALDVGTGAGFPGIPLKIVYPGLQVVLLDSNRKKISFLTAVAAALGLKGVRVLHGRWQDFSKDAANAHRFELITMRALRFEPEYITGLASRVLASGGVLARWRSAALCTLEESEGCATDKSLYSGMEFQGDFNYLLPGIKHPRSVRLWRKTADTSDTESSRFSF